jgi:hypothetical protein
MPAPRQIFIEIHPEAPPKPAWGAPCNGCGICCLAEPCPLGMLISRRRQGACDALRWQADAGRYVCGMLSEPQQVLGWQGAAGRALAPLLQRLARRWISAGSGCDASLQAEAAPD